MSAECDCCALHCIALAARRTAKSRSSFDGTDHVNRETASDSCTCTYSVAAPPPPAFSAAAAAAAAAAAWEELDT